MADYTEIQTGADWQQECRTLVREFESSEHAWRQAEVLLRRAGMQLAMAAMDRSKSLDRSLGDVAGLLQGAHEPDQLRNALERLSAAVFRETPKPLCRARRRRGPRR